MEAPLWLELLMPCACGLACELFIKIWSQLNQDFSSVATSSGEIWRLRVCHNIVRHTCPKSCLAVPNGDREYVHDALLPIVGVHVVASCNKCLRRQQLSSIQMSVARDRYDLN